MDEIKQLVAVNNAKKLETAESASNDETEYDEKYLITVTDHENEQASNSKTDQEVVTIEETIEEPSIYDTYHSDDETCEIIQDERNILLLGPTGVGKSTFINSLANYLKFKDFYQALYAKIDILSPCEFTIVDDSLNNRKFRFEKDIPDEEDPSSGLRCQTYEIKYRNHLLRIFDIPGFGDARGVEQDRINLEETFDILSKYEELHCICIALKSNESKLTTTFRYFIQQFLVQLPKNAMNNIAFLFTHSRETFFRPGDTVEPLKAIIDSIEGKPPHVKIPLNIDNMFCLDNEAFKFLLAFQNGVELSEDQRKQYAKSWEKSEKESLRMIEFITGGEDGRGLKAYGMEEFLCVANVRRAVDELRNPLAQTMENILNNLNLISRQIRDIRDCGRDKNQLTEILSRPIVRFRIKEIDKPRTVCNSEKCVKNYRADNSKKSHFVQVCCDPCECLLDEFFKAEKIRNCAAFIRETGVCIKCNCPYSQHKQIYYETVIENDESLEQTNAVDVIQVSEQTMENLKSKSEKLIREKENLITYAAKLAMFLKQNAIFPYNDKFEATFRLQIQTEEMLIKGGWNDAEVLESLDKMLSSYRSQIERMEGAVGVEEALETIRMLYSMESSTEVLAVAIEAKIKKEMTSGNVRWIKIIAGVTTGVGIVGLAGAVVFAPPLIIPAAVITVPAVLTTGWIFLKNFWSRRQDADTNLKSISTSHNLIYSD